MFTWIETQYLTPTLPLCSLWLIIAHTNKEKTYKRSTIFPYPTPIYLFHTNNSSHRLAGISQSNTDNLKRRPATLPTSLCVRVTYYTSSQGGLCPPTPRPSGPRARHPIQAIQMATAYVPISLYHEVALRGRVPVNIQTVSAFDRDI